MHAPLTLDLGNRLFLFAPRCPMQPLTHVRLQAGGGINSVRHYQLGKGIGIQTQGLHHALAKLETYLSTYRMRIATARLEHEVCEPHGLCRHAGGERTARQHRGHGGRVLTYHTKFA